MKVFGCASGGDDDDDAHTVSREHLLECTCPHILGTYTRIDLETHIHMSFRSLPRVEGFFGLHTHTYVYTYKVHIYIRSKKEEQRTLNSFVGLRRDKQILL